MPAKGLRASVEGFAAVPTPAKGLGASAAGVAAADTGVVEEPKEKTGGAGAVVAAPAAGELDGDGAKLNFRLDPVEAGAGVATEPPPKKLGMTPGVEAAGVVVGAGAGGLPMPKPRVFLGPSSDFEGAPKLNGVAGFGAGADASVDGAVVGGDGGGAVIELLARGDEALGLELTPGARSPSEGLLSDTGGAATGAGAAAGAGLRRLMREEPELGSSDKSSLARWSSAAISSVIFPLPLAVAAGFAA